MHVRTLLTLATVAFATAAFSQCVVDVFPDDFQVRYASNLNKGDSVINITNTGSDVPVGDNLCVNVYTFDPSEEMVSCCS